MPLFFKVNLKITIKIREINTNTSIYRKVGAFIMSKKEEIKWVYLKGRLEISHKIKQLAVLTHFLWVAQVLENQ